MVPVSILHKSIAGRYRPIMVADGPITARCRFKKNASCDARSGGKWGQSRDAINNGMLSVLIKIATLRRF